MESGILKLIKITNENIDIFFKVMASAMSEIKSGDKENIENASTEHFMANGEDTDFIEAFVVSYNDKNIGVIVLGKFTNIESDKNGELKYIFISKPYRYQGFGSILLTFAKNRMKEKGYKMLYAKAINFRKDFKNFLLCNEFIQTTMVLPIPNSPDFSEYVFINKLK